MCSEVTKAELVEQLKYIDDNDDVYVMVGIEKRKDEGNRLYMDFSESRSKMHITHVTKDQFHCTLHIPRIVV